MPQPSLGRALSFYNSPSSAMSSRRYTNMAHPNLHAWNTSQQFMPAASHGQKMHHVPSPLGRAAFHSGSPPSITAQTKEQRGQDMMQTQMCRLYRNSQEHQDWQLLQNQRAMLQKAREAEVQRQDWFVHGNRTFTLAECVLVCALKSFCRPLDSRIGISDETISEIIQYQRGWHDSDGIDCRGLYVALVRSRDDIRGRIETLLCVHRHKWEQAASRAYWAWMSTMGAVAARYVLSWHMILPNAYSDFDRMVFEGQMDKDTGQISGSGFDGNVHDHLYSKSLIEEFPHTAMNRTMSMAEIESFGMNSAAYQHGATQSASRALAVSITLVSIITLLSSHLYSEVFVSMEPTRSLTSPPRLLVQRSSSTLDTNLRIFKTCATPPPRIRAPQSEESPTDLGHFRTEAEFESDIFGFD